MTVRIRALCAGSYLDWSKADDECGGKFCPVCEARVDMIMRSSISPSSHHELMISGHESPGIRQCGNCEDTVYDPDDYLCDECRE